MRVTLSQQIQDVNQKNADLQRDMQALVQQANERIQEEINERIRAVKEAQDNAAEEVSKAKKDLETAKGNTKYYSDKNSEFNQQINHLHDLLDLVPDAIPRKKPDDQYSENTVAMRIMSYFVSQKK